MENINLFKSGYEFASNCEKSFDDMHSKFDSLQENETSAFMLGYAFYLMEIAKFLDGASTESLTSKVNLGIATQCLNSVVAQNDISNDDALKLSSTMYDMANQNLDDVAKAVLEIC